MSEPRWILIALLAVLALASARLCWQQWRGPARARGMFAGLLLMQAAVTVLLYLPLLPPLQRVPGKGASKALATILQVVQQQ